MKSLFLVIAGVVIGFLVTSRFARTPGGATFVSRVDARTRAFRGAVVDGYRSREAELRAEPGTDA